jgi:aspartyl-tRNA(Asn)/glutamyl-tRNA(Gln) amidotransferase subunit A
MISYLRTNGSRGALVSPIMNAPVDLPSVIQGVLTLGGCRYDGVRYGHRVGSPGGFGGESGARPGDQGALHAFYTANRTEGFGAEVQRRILTGCFVLSAKAYSAYYEAALVARAQLRMDFAAALREVDVLLTPTTPTGPFPLEQPAEPAALLLNDIMTIPANLTGLPAMSVPVGLAPSPGSGGVPLPVGLQVRTPFFIFHFFQGRSVCAHGMC